MGVAFGIELGLGERAEMIVTVRLMIEQAAIEGREICIGFQDLSTCFMSIVKEIQFQLEAALGVEPEISVVIKALHTNVTRESDEEWEAMEQLLAGRLPEPSVMDQDPPEDIMREYDTRVVTSLKALQQTAASIIKVREGKRQRDASKRGEAERRERWG